MSSKRDKNPRPLDPGRGDDETANKQGSRSRGRTGGVAPNFDHKKGARRRSGNRPTVDRNAGETRAARRRARKSQDEKPAKEPVAPISPKVRWGVAALLLIAFAWAFFPTLKLLQSDWERLPDYSHGYLVIPFAIFLGYLRRDSRPELSPGFSWFGLFLMIGAVALRWFGDAYYFPVIGSYSLVVWVAGAVWLIGGFRTFWWSLPSVAFLLFMIPLPSRFAPMLSGTLQTIATNISTWLLQLLGQPALAEGNTISLGEHTLEVEQACSGLRIFVSILALAFFFIFMTRRPWWQSVLIALSTLPIALAANALRIVFTGLLIQQVSSEAAEKFSHDFAGWVMIPVACLFFLAFLWYLSHVFVRVEQVSLGEMTRRKSGPGNTSPAATS